MSLATVFDKLGQSIIPAIAAKVFPDSMYVVSETTTSDGGGSLVKSAVTDTDHRNDDPIPCTYEPTSTGFKASAADRLTSITRYKVTYPTHQYGTRILISVGNRLTVLARGNEPEKTFRVLSIGNYSGVNFEAECELEDAT